jgi:hypothetical protein
MVKHTSISNIYLMINKSIEGDFNRHSLYIHPLRHSITPYSIYLDGFPIAFESYNAESNGKIDLKLITPLIPIKLEYTLWKK